MDKVQAKIVHYGQYDPDAYRGGVETFARNLRMVFDDVAFMWEGAFDPDRIRDEKRMTICDNHWVVDVPEDIPAIGFQHGVAAEKLRQTGSRRDRDMARRQARAAARPNTIWVACADWISRAFGDLHGNAACFVIYHHVDLERFDGVRGDVDPRLVLHDARQDHKGGALVARLGRWFPDWRFEPLDCAPDAVPDRMRRARAFLHLSRYEGNSVVCNEAMAMDLPCFVTEAGLFRDAGRPRDVWIVDRDAAFADGSYLKRELGGFLRSLDERAWNPRAWILENAHVDVARQRWTEVFDRWRAMSGWR